MRSVAEECARLSPGPVTFYARKGADCLGKYSGDAERTLRLIFDEAKKRAPSIVFLDEVGLNHSPAPIPSNFSYICKYSQIDALVPCRSVRGGTSDQIYASIVSTLLSLMDGVSGRGHVVVIGATNRPDCIDSALRRPGRFDREILVGLPSLEDRMSILSVHTSHWPQPHLRERVLRRLASATDGYAGADLAALCASAVVCAAKRTFQEFRLEGENNARLQSASKRKLKRQRIDSSYELMDFEELGLLRSLDTKMAKEQVMLRSQDLVIQSQDDEGGSHWARGGQVEDQGQRSKNSPPFEAPSPEKKDNEDNEDDQVTSKDKAIGSTRGSFLTALIGFASSFKRSSALAHITVEASAPSLIDQERTSNEKEVLPPPPTSPPPSSLPSALSLDWIPKVQVMTCDWKSALGLAPNPSSLREPLSVLCPISFSSKVDYEVAIKCLPALHKSITLLKQSFHGHTSISLPSKLATVIDQVDLNEDQPDASYQRLASIFLNLDLISGQSPKSSQHCLVKEFINGGTIDEEDFDAHPPSLHAASFASSRILLYSHDTAPATKVSKHNSPNVPGNACARLLLSLMEGAQVVTMNLGQMIFKGQGNPSVGLLEALNDLPHVSSSLLVLYIPNFDNWATGSGVEINQSREVKVRKAPRSARASSTLEGAMKGGAICPELEYGSSDSLIIAKNPEACDLWSIFRQGLESRLSRQPVIVLATTQKGLDKMPQIITSFFQVSACGLTEPPHERQAGPELVRKQKGGKRHQNLKISKVQISAAEKERESRRKIIPSSLLEDEDPEDEDQKQIYAMVAEIEQRSKMNCAARLISGPLHNVSVISGVRDTFLKALHSQTKGGFNAFKSEVIGQVMRKLSANPQQTSPDSLLDIETRISISAASSMLDACQQVFWETERLMEKEKIQIGPRKRQKGRWVAAL